MAGINIIVTGEHVLAPVLLKDGRKVNWQVVPVLKFDRLPVDPVCLTSLCEKPFDWILFTSPRTVQKWTETLIEHQLEFPYETQVACIGEETADAASQDGFTADFFPVEPGSEGFLKEFEEMISNVSQKPSVLIPMAAGGRRLIENRLKQLGCDVKVLPIYETAAREDISSQTTQKELDSAEAILFTSPSSFDALRKYFEISPKRSVLALGNYTAEHLRAEGYAPKTIPGSDFSRIGEVL